jgi:hypothetical protein
VADVVHEKNGCSIRAPDPPIESVQVHVGVFVRALDRTVGIARNGVDHAKGRLAPSGINCRGEVTEYAVRGEVKRAFNAEEWQAVERLAPRLSRVVVRAPGAQALPQAAAFRMEEHDGRSSFGDLQSPIERQEGLERAFATVKQDHRAPRHEGPEEPVRV